jgi:hypothetical protein
VGSSPALADIWVDRLGAVVGPPWQSDPAIELLDSATDEAGNVYVAGYFRGTTRLGATMLSAPNPNGLDEPVVECAFAAKMDDAGNWLWAAQAGGGYEPWTSDSRANGIALGDDGSVYVAGEFTGHVAFGDHQLDTLLQQGAPGEPNAFAAALDASGHWAWAVQGGGGGTASAAAVAVGPDGSRPPGPDGLPHSAVYLVGNSRAQDYVAGQRFGPITGVTCPLKYCNNTDSNTAGLSCATDDECGTGLCQAPKFCQGGDLDGFGCSVDGDCTGGGTCDDYPGSCDGGYYGGQPCLGDAQCYHASSPDAECLFDLFCQGGANEGNACERRCSVTTAEHCDTDQDCPSGETCDPQDLCPGGTCGEPDPCEDEIFVGKLTADGQWLDAQKRGGVNVDVGSDVAVDGEGSVYVTGTSVERVIFQNTIATWCCCSWFLWCWDYGYCCTATIEVDQPLECAQTMKLNSSGGEDWSRLVCTAPESEGAETTMAVDSVALDHVGNVHVSGSYQGFLFDHEPRVEDYDPSPVPFPNSGDVEDIFVARYDGDGLLQWVDATGRLANNNRGGALAIDDEGSIIVGGSSDGQAFLTKWFPQGGFVWGQEPLTQPAVPGSGAAVKTIAVDPQGDVFFAGSLEGTVSVSDPGEERELEARGESDGLYGKLGGADGSWRQRFGLTIAVSREESAGPYSLHGQEPSPPIGETWYLEQAEVEAITPAVDDMPDSDEEDRFAAGWLGTGSVPPRAGGDPGNRVAFTMEESSTLTWLYRRTQLLDVGREIPAPDGVDVTGWPEMDDIEVVSGDASGTSFVKNVPDGKLYAVRPVVANIRWPTADGYYEQRCAFGWPADAQYHVAGSPTPLEPEDGQYRYLGVLYPDGYEPAQEPTSGNMIFDAVNEGYYVIHYAHTYGQAPDLNAHDSYFEVVRTVEVAGEQTPGTLFFPCAPESSSCPEGGNVAQDDVPCTIGEPISPDHDPPEWVAFGAGYVLRDRAPYDALDGIYDRRAREGWIVPVNEVIDGVHDDLIVVWYQESQFIDGVFWGYRPTRYLPAWPDECATNGNVEPCAQRIVIDEELGSEHGDQPLLSEFPSMQIYDQPDTAQPGFNPNDEHALFALSHAGTNEQALFALRSDVAGAGEAVYASRPYVVLKYDDADAGRWAYQTYRVYATECESLPGGCPPGEEGQTTLSFDEIAGTPVARPYPLSLLPPCPETWADADSVPFWKDYKDVVWARAAGDMEVRYFYPLQLGFHYPYDLDGDFQADDEPGTCVPWLDHFAGTPGTPAGAVYTVVWPDQVPELSVGETLLRAKKGLPEITGQAGAEIVYDDLELDGGVPYPETSLARLIDPLSPRSFGLSELPPSIATLKNLMGEDVLMGKADGTSKLPFHLQARVSYDAINTMLRFKGYLDESVAGEPLVLLNVMTSAERDLLLGLNDEVCDTDGDSDCDRDDPLLSDYGEAVKQLYWLSRNPRSLDLDLDTIPDDAVLIGLQDELIAAEGTAGSDGIPELLRLVGVPGALTAGAAGGTGYLTLAFNNDAALSPLPVSLNVIRVTCPSYQGEVKVIESDNAFDELLTLRHSGDFGGEPERFWFEWYRALDPNCGDDAANENCTPDDDPVYWGLGPFMEGEGLADITIDPTNPVVGLDPEVMLADNYFFVKYRSADSDNTDPYTYEACAPSWSEWAGAPGSTTDDPYAMLAEGWVKRVVRKFNPFEARVKAFHTTPANTYASMLVQLGERYEGDIALTDDPDYLNSVGLIEAYETLMRRALMLKGTYDTTALNSAVLLAASRIAGFYMLLGNEGYADACDPTIGLGTDSELGSLAPAIFAFQNQLDSPLDEELALLRGRGEGNTSASPVYNRLFWNFTSGDGEIAYAQTYNVTDQPSDQNGDGVIDQDEAIGDGVIDETDARVLFPQGHGDAWGSYLTAIKTYYGLLGDPYFTWTPRAEQVLVAGVPVDVDYLDERTFATAAALKARTGAEILDLTYRRSYVEDPEAQWQGYRDADTARAWGVDGWARRAGQGAYFDWVVANSLLPAEDTVHTGIQKIDRNTVLELREIASQFAAVQAQLDEADDGLNPLGLAKGVVPFDIDPARVAEGETHFEQIYDRALKSLRNLIRVFDRANLLSQSLRRNQDDVNDFVSNVKDRERDYMNRLIEIFGYPYIDDTGPGRTYRSGYNGPDLYHYMYVDATELTGSAAPAESEEITAYFSQLPGGGFDLPVEGDYEETEPIREVRYRLALDGTGLVKPAHWLGARRAPGEIQLALSDVYQNRARFEKALVEYGNLLQEIEDEIALLDAHYGLKADKIWVWDTARNWKINLGARLAAAKYVRSYAEGQIFFWEKFSWSAIEALPTVVGLSNDAMAPVRATLASTAVANILAMDKLAGVFKGIEGALSVGMGIVDSWTDIELTTDEIDFEILQRVKLLEQLVRREPVARLELFTLQEVVRQSLGDYRTTLAGGERLLAELIAFRKATEAQMQTHRYRDMTFRVFRNDALQKYRAQLDLSSRYAYLAATAYDYETNLLGSAGDAGRQFLTDIVRERGPGEVIGGVFGQPVAGSRGLADPLARMDQNFAVLKGQLGFNNPQTETNRFSLRTERFRIQADSTSDQTWRDELQMRVVPNLWDVPEFRRYARPFAAEEAGAQPGLVIPFDTAVVSGSNFFGWPLGGGDSAYDPSNFATKVRSVGVWLEGYDETGLSETPRVYLVPVGMDVLRSTDGMDFRTREWRVIDQKLPVPFPIHDGELEDPWWIPIHDNLSEEFADIRRFSSFRAYHDSGTLDPSEMTTDTRLIGRSVWNTEWLLIIPGSYLLTDPDIGIDAFINGGLTPGSDGVTDIKLFFQTYAYSGN